MTHHNLVNNGRDFGYRIGYHEGEHAVCCNPPFFHTFGLTISTSSFQLRMRVERCARMRLYTPPLAPAR